MSDAPPRSPPPTPPAGEGVPGSRFVHEAMACRWGLSIFGEEARYARQAADAAFAEIDRLERELSRFIAHSDIARINTLRAGQSLRLGVDALECLQLAAEVHRQTGGVFDVTVGAARPPHPPEGARPFGLHWLEVDPAGRSVTLRADGLVVDLGGIGKGYALDRAVAVLREWSISAALLDSGQSTVYALGRPPGQSGWTVTIRHPVDHSAALGRVCLCEAALGGSGMLLHGRHIIDPRTGQPAEGVRGAWALAPSAARADAFSTAFMVLSPAEVADCCRRHPEVSGLQYIEAPAGPSLLRHGSGFGAI